MDQRAAAGVSPKQNDEDAASLRRAGGRPTRARADEIRSAIFAAALTEFSERGFHGGSIVRIAELANVTRATVYKHFSSKEVLLELLARHTSTRLRTSIDDVIDLGRPIWEVLQEVGRCFYKDSVASDSKAISRILVMESERFPEIVQKGYELRFYALEPLASYLVTLSMNGKIAVDDAPRAAEQFMHLVTGSVDLLFAKNAITGKEQEQWIASAVRIFLHGVLRA